MGSGTKRHSKPSRHTRRAQATRNKLLDAARSLFAEKGFNLTSIDDITKRADVGKGTFYYHFSNWEEIIEALVTRMLDELLAVMEENCRDISDLKGILDALIGAHIKFFCNRWEDFVLFFQSRTELTLEQSYESIETPFLEYLKRVEDILAPTIQRQLPQPILRRIACAVVGFVSGYYSFASIVSQEEDVDQTFRSLRGAMVASLARFIQEATPPLETEEQNPGGINLT
ncbi:MAG: TetR/AcrR family transcriptional regulator [Candidatus Euphemobacter frigidus]|nr:TetR/AcrR family transcriptional regulator [Candidatus Euphemobacter frigidus]MDP8275026.1 TetR/AcrR family transcriptional regulator [Candidatus Euphemobacter frigidus]